MSAVHERFWAKVDRRGPDECWPWLAGVGSHGYGAFYPSRRKQVLAHRFALTLESPTDLRAEATHECDNKVCVNPRHLRWALHEQNMFETALRGRAKPGRTLPGACPSGHAYTPENTLTSTKAGRHGKRYEVHACRECNRIYLARRRAALKEARRG